MTTFSSRRRKLKVWGENGKWSAAFEPYGRFITDDEKLIEGLRDHGSFGKDFVEAKMPTQPKDNLIQGIRSSGNRPVLGEREKLIRFGVLQTKLLKNDNTPRRDAPEGELNELSELKLELGV